MKCLASASIYIYVVFKLLCVLEGKVKYFLDVQIIPKKRYITEQKFRNILFQRVLCDQYNYTRVLLDVQNTSFIVFA